ncbi:MAG: TcpQ domain-containing protein, partial [Proteobacteria bacterium]|nr:TcpQ domain-containing protein [Pseudomonadota bacterium]
FNGNEAAASPIARVEEGAKHGYARTIMPDAAANKAATPQAAMLDKSAAADTAQPQNALPQKNGASGKKFSMDDLLKNVVKDIAGIETSAGEEKRMRSETVAASVPERKQETMLARSWVDPATHDKSSVVARPPSVSGEAGNWRAMKGNNLHEILKLWSAQENIDVMWYADTDFTVQKSVSAQGSYEQAVLGLLEQYEKENIRPVGRIYNDAALGRRVLLVELQESAE